MNNGAASGDISKSEAVRPVRRLAAVLDYPWIIGYALIAIIMIALNGCASVPAIPYWVKVRPAQPRTAPIYLPYVQYAGVSEWGLYDQTLNLIFVKSTLPSYVRRCVVKHEDHHQDGFDHPMSLPVDAFIGGVVDCGDGTWISGATIERLSR